MNSVTLNCADRRRRLFRFLAFLGAGGAALAAGLPEPSVLVYGVVTDELGRRRTQGQVTLVLESASASSPVRVTVPLRDVNGQFSFVAPLPAETPVAGRPRTLGRLALTRTPETWRLSPAVDNVPLNLLPASRSNLVVSLVTRGALVRTDVSAGLDTDGNGLVDAWERLYFGGLGVDPNGNPAGDGISNLAKMYAGLDPRATAGPGFRFTLVQTLPDGTLQIEWSSEAGRTYGVQRAASLDGPFATIQSPINATPPANRFVDAAARDNPSFFYRIEQLP